MALQKNVHTVVTGRDILNIKYANNTIGVMQC